jgi:hypothetical protein
LPTRDEVKTALAAVDARDNALNEQETTMWQRKSKRRDAEGRASGYIRDAAEAAKEGWTERAAISRESRIRRLTT